MFKLLNINSRLLPFRLAVEELISFAVPTIFIFTNHIHQNINREAPWCTVL